MKIFFLYVISFVIISLFFILNVYAENSVVTPQTSAIPQITALPTVVPSLSPTTDPNAVQLKDVYEVLLKTKDDKITLVSNMVNWIIAISAIIVTIVLTGFGWMINKVRVQSDKTAELINRLEEKEKHISETQEKIDNYLESKEFNKKMTSIESTISRINNKIEEWEEEERLQDINRKIAPISWRLSDFNRNNMIERVNDEDDRRMYRLFSDIVNANKAGEKIEISTNDLENYSNLASKLVRKYKREGDMII